jgi:hypothetical protein
MVVNSTQATIAVIDALDAVGVPYMLVGSLASNLYGVVRSTKDADFVVQCHANAVPAIIDHLGPEFRLDPQVSFETVTATTRYIVEMRERSFRIELFRLTDDPHDQQRFQRRRSMSVSDFNRRVFVPTVEDVIITKLRWAAGAQRGKDRDDVRDVIAVQGDRIDWEYVNRWCDQHRTRSLLDEIRKSIPPIERSSAC